MEGPKEERPRAEGDRDESAASARMAESQLQKECSARNQDKWKWTELE